jgi:hypothetical protein
MEPSYTAGGKCKMVQMLWKTIWKFLRKLNIESPYDSATPLLGIYPIEMKHFVFYTITGTQMLITKFSTIAKM